MLKFHLFFILVAVKSWIAPSAGEKSRTGFHSQKNGYRIEKVGQLPDSVKESSGLEIKSATTFWTHGDGATPSKLYEISKSGEVVSVTAIKEKNTDWEDMTKDANGNLYIGDFGNNNNSRRDLRIIKTDSLGKIMGLIEFSYPDQFDFPPDKEKRNFDCEAMVWFKDSLYLFSKNRGEKTVKVYSLPTVPGKYSARITGSFYLNSMITGAAMSPDEKKLALLAYGKVYFFNISYSDGLKLKPDFSKRFSRKQAEALVFTNNTDLLISNEQGNLYSLKKKK